MDPPVLDQCKATERRVGALRLPRKRADLEVSISRWIDIDIDMDGVVSQKGPWTTGPQSALILVQSANVPSG